MGVVQPPNGGRGRWCGLSGEQVQGSWVGSGSQKSGCPPSDFRVCGQGRVLPGWLLGRGWCGLGRAGLGVSGSSPAALCHVGWQGAGLRPWCAGSCCSAGSRSGSLGTIPGRAVGMFSCWREPELGLRLVPLPWVGSVSERIVRCGHLCPSCFFTL